MTFTVVARCPDTRALGICLATSSIGVSSRCPHLLGGVAAISSQCHSDPRLGAIGLALARQGIAPSSILEVLQASDPHFAWRQVGIVDAEGRAAAHSGDHGKAYTGHRIGDGFVVMGNHLAGPQVIDAMQATYQATGEGLFEERLMRTVEAGAAAGGEPAGQKAAGLMVALPNHRPRTWLQIDFTQDVDAVADLRRVFDAYKPYIDYYAGFWPDHPTVDQQGWLAREHAA